MLIAENIKGFDKINLNANMFKSFLNNFYNNWGEDARKTIKPISVKFVKEHNKKYLKFDYEIYGRKEWLHVVSPITWY